MNKEKKHNLSEADGLIPELRFPEFNEVWDLEELEQCLDYLQPTPYLVEGTDYKDEYETPVLTAGKSFILGYTDEKEGVFKDNLPVIIFDDFTTASKFVDFPFKTKSSAMKILLAKNGYNIKFLYESMQTIDYEVGVHKRHWISVFSKLKIAVPNPQEQQKIASCLSSLDELITAHNDKLEALKDHKKGLMQNLFPQEGEKVPKIRFSEFEKDGEWVEKALDEVAMITKGKGISKSDIVENGNLPCIRYGELYTDYSETISDIKSYTNIDDENLILSEENDVIIPSSGETHIDIARASCVMQKGVALGGDLNIIKTKINGVFLAYYLNNAKKRDIAQIAQGISVIHLYANQLKTLMLKLPNPKEQQKIASCLSALDELIMAQSGKIEQLQQHKKGLMQGLFPSAKR